MGPYLAGFQTKDGRKYIDIEGTSAGESRFDDGPFPQSPYSKIRSYDNGTLLGYNVGGGYTEIGIDELSSLTDFLKFAKIAVDTSI